ncbi:hypothetical protein ACFX12_036370 [Malus domestica]
MSLHGDAIRQAEPNKTPQQQNPPPLSLPCPRGNSLPHSLTHFFSSTPATPNSLITIPVFATLSSPLENPPLAQDGPNGSTRKPISLSSGMYQSPVTIALWEARLKIFERFFLDPPKDAPSHNRTKILYSAFVGVSKTSLMVRREPQQTPVGVARNSSDSGRVRSFVVPSACSEAAALRFGLFQAKRACYSGLEPQLIHNNVKSSNEEPESYGFASFAIDLDGHDGSDGLFDSSPTLASWSTTTSLSLAISHSLCLSFNFLDSTGDILLKGSSKPSINAAAYPVSQVLAVWKVVWWFALVKGGDGCVLWMVESWEADGKSRAISVEKFDSRCWLSFRIQLPPSSQYLDSGDIRNPIIDFGWSLLIFSFPKFGQCQNHLEKNFIPFLLPPFRFDKHAMRVVVKTMSSIGDALTKLFC